ncbi:MAG: LapA family protein [Synergistaceae bacterium]|jgi:uncharacterized integral membrane protein|nr:LapA family protein [Synergistaceae bacterium]
MKAYILAIAVSILLSAIYAVQNSEEITVRFFAAWTFRQGIWEAILFSGGVLLMWLFSVYGSVESYRSNRRTVREKDRRISELEEEKKSLLSAIAMTPREHEERVQTVHEREAAPVSDPFERETDEEQKGTESE